MTSQPFGAKEVIVTEEMLEVLISAIIPSMSIIRQYQLFGVPKAKTKEDQTAVTIADTESGQKIKEILEKSFPIPLNFDIEDVGKYTNNRDCDLIAMIDSLDGTGAFIYGLPTSTIIIAIYSKSLGQVIACVIGEPISGRIWYATKWLETKYFVHNYENGTWEGNAEKKVWPKGVDEKCPLVNCITLDVSHGFTRTTFVGEKKEVLTGEQNAALYTSLNKMIKILGPGSNGLMQALVGAGGQKLIGSITSAIGGPYDVCGVLLVLMSGGCANGWFRRPDGLWKRKDPLDVISYDVLITANTLETLEFLESHFLKAVA